MKFIAVFLLTLFVSTALAQIGAPKSTTQLNTEVNTSLANNTVITPTVLRQILLDIVASSLGPQSGVTAVPNTVLAGPSAGTTAAAPTFRALTTADLPANITFSNVINVKAPPYNAKGNGPANDTLAVQAALTAAATAITNEFWGNQFVAVYFPAGNYHICGLTMQPRMKIYGDGPGQTTLSLTGACNKSAIIINGVPATYSSATSSLTWGEVDDMTLSGFASGQTGISHGIEVSDSTVGFYQASLIARNVNIFGFHDDGIHVGTSRSNGYLDRVESANNSGDGIEINGFDWFITNSSFGANGASGMNINSFGCTMAVNTSFFSNNVGITIGSSSGCDTKLVNGSIDRNKLQGIDDESRTSLAISNFIFSSNSAISDGTYPVILLNNAGPVAIDNTAFSLGAEASSYIIQQTGTTNTVNWGLGNQISTGTYQTSVFSNPTGVTGASPGSDENRIINGDMAINQRFGTAAVQSPNGNLRYSLDHWGMLGTTTSNRFTVAQDSATPPSGFDYDALITSNVAITPSASDVYYFRQIVEGIYMDDLQWGTASAEPIIFSFWAKSSLAGPFSLSFTNSASNRSYVTQYTISHANTWQYFAILVPGETTGVWASGKNQIGINVYFDVGTGADKQQSSNFFNSWQVSGKHAATGSNKLIGTSGATLQITGVRMRQGMWDVAYIPRPYQTEVELAQRYYQNSFPEGTQAANNAGVAGSVCSLATVASSLVSQFIRFPQPMMDVPSITTYNPSAANANWRDVTTSSDLTVSVDPSSALSANGVQIASSSAAAGQGDNVCIHWAAQAEF